MATPSKAQVRTLIDQLQAIAQSDTSQDKATLSSETAVQLQAAATKLTQLTTSPFEASVKVTTEPVRSMVTRVAVDCRWFEILKEAKDSDGRGDGSLTAEILADKSNVDKRLLIRMMRVLTCEGIVDEVDVETYRANELTAMFCIPGTADGVKVWFDIWAPLFLKMPKYFAHFGYPEPNDFATCPFPFAMGQSIWKHIAEDPARQTAFNSYIGATRGGRLRWVDMYPIHDRIITGLKASEDSAVVIDVGGGWGHDIRDFVTFESVEKANIKGHSILQDLDTGLPPDDAQVRQDLVKHGVKIMTYDFFTPQPVKGARVYSFRSILHDWPDAECRQILANTISAMEKGYSKILVNEIVIPDKGAAPWHGWIDMAVMGGAAAKERSYKDWEELFDSVGLKIVATFPMGLETAIEVDLK